MLDFTIIFSQGDYKMSITREFHGFKVSDDFVLTLNARGGTKQINLQEMMAIRLSKSIDGKKYPWSSSNPDITDTVAKDLDISYNHETNCRSTNQWINARQHFSKNNSLSKEQEGLLDGFKSRNGSKSESGITFNTTHAKNFGNYIFQRVHEKNQTAFASFDPNHTEFKSALWDKVAREVSAVLGIANYEVIAKHQEKIRKEQKAKREKQLAELKAAAVNALSAMGITEDNEQYETMLKTQMGLLESVLKMVS